MQFLAVLAIGAFVGGLVLLARRAPAPEPGSLSAVFEAGHAYSVTVQASKPLVAEEMQVLRASLEANGVRDVKFSNDKRQVTFRRAPQLFTVEIVAGDPFLTVPVPSGGTVSFTIISFSDLGSESAP